MQTFQVTTVNGVESTALRQRRRRQLCLKKVKHKAF